MTSQPEQSSEQTPPVPKRKPPRRNADFRKKPPHRPKTYTPEQAIAWQTAICAWVMSGKSVAAFCDIPGNPTTFTIATWRRESVGFSQAYAQAREDGADAWADEIVHIADGVKNCRDSAMVNAARLRVDARKWAASKLKPKVYGDRIEQLVGNADGSPMQPSSTMIDDAVRARILATYATMQAIERAPNLAALVSPIVEHKPER